MKLYVAGSVKQDKEKLKLIIDFLQYEDYKITFDWTRIDQDKMNVDLAYKRQVLRDELWGVANCDVFVMVLKGGRGAHIEMGYALARNKKVLILANSKEDISQVAMYDKGNEVQVCYSIRELLEKLETIKDDSLKIPF